MNKVMLIFFSLSISGSLLALVLFALGPAVKKRLSQTWQYYIWLVVVLRFLLPFAPETSLVGEFVKYYESSTMEEIVASTNMGIIAEVPTDIPPVLPSPPQYDEPGEAETVMPPVSWSDFQDNLWLLWFGVALILFVRKATNYQSFVRLMRTGNGTEMITDEHMLKLYREELAVVKIRRVLPLYRNDQVSSPMQIGILRPALILPELDVSDDELRSILRHELTHYKRLDFLYKWLTQITLCLHWFNPVIYFIAKRINKSCELSCDESVIKNLDRDGRITYGSALLASVTAQGAYSFAASMSMSEDCSIVKERLDMIMRTRKRSAITTCVAGLLTIALLCGFIGVGAYTASNKPDSQTQESTENLTAFSDTENKISELHIDSTGVNIIVELSEDDTFHYEFDQSAFDILVSDTNTSKTISVSQKIGVLDRFPSFVTVKIPNIPYQQIYFTGDRSGMNLPAINANMDIKIVNGSCAVNIPHNYDKTCNLNLNTGSGVMRLHDNLLFTLDAVSANPSMPSSWPDYRYGQTYSYQLGQSTGKVNIVLDTCSFVVETGQSLDNTDAAYDVMEPQYSEEPDKTGEERRKEILTVNFEKYKPLGVVYDAEKDAVFYDGNRVRLFVDFKEGTEPNVFELCYRDENAGSSLDLQVIENASGMVEISALDQKIAGEILGEMRENDIDQRIEYKPSDGNPVDYTEYVRSWNGEAIDDETINYTPFYQEDNRNAVDAAAAHVMEYSRSWSTVQYLLPYMTNEGIDDVVAINNQQNPNSLKTAADYYDLEKPTQADTDERALQLMQNTGNWMYASSLFPHMSNAGIDKVIALHNQKTGQNRNGSQYYN
jgi:beta-lactamase regulating signal transducer with metallopeptidase domain